MNYEGPPTEVLLDQVLQGCNLHGALSISARGKAGVFAPKMLNKCGLNELRARILTQLREQWLRYVVNE